MYEVLTASLSVSLLHAAIPNHWLPIVAIGKKNGWRVSKAVRITMLAGSAHAISTVLIGLALSVLGWKMNEWMDVFSSIAAPILLIGLGLVFIWRHYYHRHFHLHTPVREHLGERELVAALALAMFLSPCLEIGAFFLMAGAHGATVVLMLSVFYYVTTVAGMAVWVWLVWHGLSLGNWHKLEHNAGIISGLILILAGIWKLFVH